MRASQLPSLQPSKLFKNSTAKVMKNLGLNKTERQYFFMLLLLLFVFTLSLVAFALAASMVKTLDQAPVVIITLGMVGFGGLLLFDSLRIED